MQFCDQAVMLRSAVRLGVFHEYFVFAARPGVHLEVTWRSLGDHLEATWSSLVEHLEATWRPLGKQVGAHFGCLEAKLELRKPSCAAWTVNLGPRGAKLRLECGLESQVGSKRRSGAAQEAPS